MSWFDPPQILGSEVYTSMPPTFRRMADTEWAQSNRPGQKIDCFLEGPCLGADGTLYVVDIPFGRIFAIDGARQWRLVAQYDGWPNGMKVAKDGNLIVADYRRGLMGIDVKSGAVRSILSTVNSEGFKGLNDLNLLPDGSILFTDQGQTGMHDATGRLYRLWPDGRLDRLIATAPSPNGVCVNLEGTYAYLALTRSAQIWRLPLDPPMLSSKTQVFAQLPGGLVGPDGIAIDAKGRLIVCDPGHGSAWVLSTLGQPLYRIRSCAGRMITNVVVLADGLTVLLTDSDSGQILKASIPA